MKKKILLIFFIILLVLSVSSSYYRFVILEDYYIEAEVDCDPETESCFAWVCDSNTEECSQDPEENTWYYKVLAGKAHDICDQNEDDPCETVSCIESNDSTCEQILCNDETLSIYSTVEACSYFSFPEETEVEELSTEEAVELEQTDLTSTSTVSNE